MKHEKTNYLSNDNTKLKNELSKHHYTLGNDFNDFKSEVNRSFRANKGIFAPAVDPSMKNATIKTNFILGNNITTYESSSQDQNKYSTGVKTTTSQIGNKGSLKTNFTLGNDKMN